MYSSISKGIALLVFISLIFDSTAEELTISGITEFKVQPQQCVTLRQGRDCFATITVQWQKPTKQSLCLYQVNKKNSDDKQKLQCWDKMQQGQTIFEFESSDTLTYQLRTKHDDQLIDETEVVVSWLHKNTTRRRRWRLF